MIFTEDELAQIDKLLRCNAPDLPETVAAASKLGAELKAKYGNDLRIQGMNEASAFFKEAHAAARPQEEAIKWIKKNSKIH